MGEVVVLELPLADSIASPQMEFSGLAWYGDMLIMLPQYPKGIMGVQDGFLYGIEKQSLTSWVEDQSVELTVLPISIDDGRLSKTLDGFEGFESIVFVGNEIFLTIETRGGDPMRAFIVKGEVREWEDMPPSIQLDANSIVELPVQNQTPNASYEALATDGELLYAFFEQYGQAQNKNPRVVVLDRDLQILEELPIDATNFRLTDATDMEEDGSFWMINYFFPGDEHLMVGSDSISERYGLPGTHHADERVERLVKFQLKNSEIEMVDQMPIYLQLLDDGNARNWEGLVKLNEDGFLIVTDKFPKTILGLIIIE